MDFSQPNQLGVNITADEINSESATSGQTLQADGAGGVAFGNNGIDVLGSDTLTGAGTTLDSGTISLSGYSHMRVVGSVRNAYAGFNDLSINFNGDNTAGNYRSQLEKTNGTTEVWSDSNDAIFARISNDNATIKGDTDFIIDVFLTVQGAIHAICRAMGPNGVTESYFYSARVSTDTEGKADITQIEITTAQNIAADSWIKVYGVV